MSDDKLLLVKDLTTTFATAGGDLTAVAHVSFDLDRNETLGIVGNRDRARPSSRARSWGCSRG